MFVVVVSFVIVWSQYFLSKLSNISIVVAEVKDTKQYLWKTVSEYYLPIKSPLKPLKQQSNHEFLLEWISLNNRMDN